MRLPGVLQMTDTLEAGGAERVAVNLARLLPRERYRSFFCTTRRDGPLASLLPNEVERICLARTRTLDLKALARLVSFIRAQEIKLLHAHGTALLVAVLASLWPPYPQVIWHNHFGQYANETSRRWSFYLLARRISQMIAVNQPLVEWARRSLRLPAERVHYVPNFVLPETPEDSDSALPALPGTKETRIICVANLRPPKDQLTLLRALARVTAVEPSVHLLLAGAESDQAYTRLLRAEIEHLGLTHHVTLLGQQQQVAALLRQCAVAVLSSVSEGLPLALLEYGSAGLATVATAVGECAEVLEQGRAGLLVPPTDAQALADALIEFLRAPQRRAELGALFRQRIEARYSPQAALRQICQVYDVALQRASRSAG
jgi:glycosyltransferase involved in cell wall biosynthesis